MFIILPRVFLLTKVERPHSPPCLEFYLLRNGILRGIYLEGLDYFGPLRMTSTHCYSEVTKYPKNLVHYFNRIPASVRMDGHIRDYKLIFI